MRIEQLEYVAAVTRYGSLRRASERLHVSQPALSEAISKLERELDVQLLERRHDGARITLRGKELLEHMMGVLDAVDRLQSAAGGVDSAARAGAMWRGPQSERLVSEQKNQAGRSVMILITGAKGTVGCPLVEALIARGRQVRTVTRDPAGVEVVAGDPSRPDARRALRGSAGGVPQLQSDRRCVR